MRLSYSAYKVYLQCPLEYWHSHVDYTTPAAPDNRINSLYGSAIGEVFEAFYTDKLWLKGSETRAALHALVEPTVDRIMAQEVKKGGIYDWDDHRANYHSRAGVIQDIHGDIDPGVETIKLHRFLGPIADAEVVLDTEVRGHIIRGRADFIIKRTAPYHDLVIVDGKGSKHRGRYVDGMQLRWYAMLYKLRYRQPPDTLAFLFWRFPPAKAVDWVPFDHHGLDSLLNEVVDACDRIEADKARLDGAPPQYGHGPFQPIPEEGHCRFCSFKDKCPVAPKKSPKAPLPGVGNGEDDISLLDL
jgi:hypothetical protein